MTLVANFGVVAGIVFLGIEIQQNTNMMQAQTRSVITQNTMSVFTPDLETAKFINRGYVGEIAPGRTGDWLFFQGYVQRVLKTWENEYYQSEQGLYDKDLLRAHQRTWTQVLKLPGVRMVWQYVGEGYSPKFRQHIDQLIQNSDEIPLTPFPKLDN